MRILTIVAALMLWAGGAEGAGTGNDLLRTCESKSICMGYVNGVIEGYIVGRRVTFGDICIPDEADWGQITDVSIKFLNEHPEHRHLFAVTLVLMAVRDAWPCPK